MNSFPSAPHGARRQGNCWNDNLFPFQEFSLSLVPAHTTECILSAMTPSQIKPLPAEKAPDRDLKFASSVLIEIGRIISRSEIIASLIEYIDSWYGIFINGEFKIILDKWKPYSGMIEREKSGSSRRG